jgi:membrane-bound metal-dependent hydrolase YbcI (DUF457 family)
MDIVTHAGIGLVAAAPLMAERPELAAGLVLGSVLPDLDALSRVFGKCAFLRFHQTWTHALPVQLLASMATGLAGAAFGIDGFSLALGLVIGLAIHILLDMSNTLGVKAFLPFWPRRFCLEWVFFIDSVILALTLLAVGLLIRRFLNGGQPPICLTIAFLGILALYIGIKGLLRRRAGTFVPEAITLIPSALKPWRFFGAIESGNCVDLFQINALTGNRETLTRQMVLDGDYAELLSNIPGFRLMRELSPAYHVVSAKRTDAGEIIVCRDLRTRNFGTSFGDLEVLLDANRKIVRTTFHV